jgi:hypothetical protein
MSIKNSYISEGFDLSHEKMGIYIEEFADNSTQLTIELEVIPGDSYNSPTFTFADLYDVKNVRDILNEYIEIVEKEL